MDPIRAVAGPLGPLAAGATSAPSPGAAPADATGGFGRTLADAVREANATQLEAESRVRDLAEGRGDLVETMLSLNRAELSLSLVTQVRNRALEAYQEIMRLQV